MSNADREAYEFYKDPAHLVPAGPVAARRIVPGLRLTEHTHAPRTATMNTGSLPRIVKEAGQ